MDWFKQSEEMFKAWTDTQQKMWETFSENVTNYGKSPGEKMWSQAINAGEELVKNSLTAQAEWMTSWSDSFKSMEGIPEQAAKSIDQFKEMTERWVTTQENLWSAWFEMLKKLDPSQFTPAWTEMPKNPFQVWQDSTKMVMDTQMEWMKTWMNQFKSGTEK